MGKLIFWCLLTAGIIISVGVCLYPDWFICCISLVVYYVKLAVVCFFKDSEATRNVIYVIAVFVSIVGGYFLYRRTKAAEQSLTTEQLTRAMDQLDSKNSSVRLGGILGLDQIAKAHKGERKKIARILVSFIRARATTECEEERQDLIAYRAKRLDIEAAVNTLASIASELEKQGEFSEEYNEQKVQLCDLQDTDLRGLRFDKADLSKFNFGGADMSGAWLTHANLSEAVLYKRHIAKGTKFNYAHLEDANFSKAHLNFVDFSGVEHAKKANFIGADLRDANFTNTVLLDVKIMAANLNGADLTDAEWTNMSDIRQYQIDKAFRRRGHDTTVISDTDHRFNPPPER